MTSTTTLGLLRFRPLLRPVVWGGRRLGEVLGKQLPSAEAYGESWEVTDHASHHSEVVSGPHAGRTLRDLMEHERRALLGAAGSRYTTFPWLVKFLDARDWLSVQVHPDEHAVKELWPGEGPKTEAWFVLDAAPGSRIYAGLVPGVDEARLRCALKAGTVADCLYQFEPRPGDCVFLPAGTVHAVGGGVLFAEVQQTSDATFRLFDWNRRDAQGRGRTLHIEESIACIDWSRGPVEPVRARAFAANENGAVTRQQLVECPFFRLEYVQSTKPFTLGGDGTLHAVIALRGSGTLTAGQGVAERFAVGASLVVPATAPEVRCTPEPELGVLVSSLP